MVLLGNLTVSLQANNPLRVQPYPQKTDRVYLNPAPLLVPYAGTESDYVQFNLAKDEKFEGAEAILSKPVPWRMFSPHKVLSEGTWYWRYRFVGKAGETGEWSDTYSFDITPDIPQFATPPVEVFLKNLPVEHPRIYCFLKDSLEQARRHMRSHPEFEAMIDDARTALATDYTYDTRPYKKISQMAVYCDNLNTAYQLMQYDLYAEKMVKNVRLLLAQEPEKGVIDNDFNAGELVYTLACTYDNCLDYFTPEEQKRIEEIILSTIKLYYERRILGREENMFFDEHFWQFTLRHFLQGALVLYDKYPFAKEYLEYTYELWSTRAPASGFNRDGSWHNGANYFSANAVSLFYVPTLFSYVTGTDFMQHPWYRGAGMGLAYTWLPGGLSDGFGDGHEKLNGKPLRIRSAFADLMARTTGDSYAAWYSSQNDRYKTETETRLYRMASGKERPRQAELPADAPKAVWFKDCGEMVANSNLQDLEHNVSLSFRSSPFGSGNHTHSCQNAFNLHYGGKAVYHAVGHYMSYADRHNLLSYRNTRAYNTMLIDGIGQPITTRASGNVARMFNGEHISYALGDASDAYCGTSEIRLWKRSFEQLGLEQSPENGLGENSLKKYRRHIFLLHPNKVLIYDELEAGEKVRWDWLLHSPVKFSIDAENAKLVTKDKDGRFTSVARLFSEQPCQIAQVDTFAAEPNRERAERGEDFTNPWTLTALFGPSKKNYILTLIQVGDKEMKVLDVAHDGNRIQCGDWEIEAELSTKRPARLFIHNRANGATFYYGKDQKVNLNGTDYELQTGGASVLYDKIDGEWKTKEMTDIQVQSMGTWHAKAVTDN